MVTWVRVYHCFTHIMLYIYMLIIYLVPNVSSFSHVWLGVLKFLDMICPALGELSRGWGICHLMWKVMEGQRDLTADKVNPL
jgi:hypothetical protein